jgi:hypothetical protein
LRPNTFIKEKVKRKEISRCEARLCFAHVLTVH